MRAMISVILLSMSAAATGRAEEGRMGKLRPVDFTQVEIADGFWSPRLEANRTRTLWACFRQCDKTGRITNFAKAGKLMKGKFEGIYFNDSDVYKVLEGAAYVLAAERDPAIEKKVDEVIRYIAAAQQPNGYLNSYYTLVEPDKKWTNLPVRHELYCAGHLFEAAVAHYKATGKKTLLNVATRFADRIDELFGKGKMEGVAGHEEIELALIKLYHLTGEARYLKLSEFFIDQRGQARNKKHEYMQAHVPVREQTDIRGHAVRAMYLYSGVADLAVLTGDRGYIDAMERIWQNVVHRKMYITGGIGSSRHNEGFTRDYDLPNDTAYAETCASIGMALWNHRLNLLHRDGRFADVVERVLYNGVLSGVSLNGEKFFYVNPLSSRGTHHRQPWYGCACCPTNIVRFLPSVGGYVYAHTDTAVWVNLYLSNTAKIKLKDVELTLKQETRYPWSGEVKLLVEPSRAGRFDVHLRIPGWCQSAACSVNGLAVKEPKPEKGYLRISRPWKAGDLVSLALAMPIERMEAHPKVAADAGRVALQRGPLVYCLEGTDHEVPPGSIALPPGAAFKAEHRPELLGGVTVITGEGIVADSEGWGPGLYQPASKTKPVRIVAVPYYAWDNRGPGPMLVWIPETVLLADRAARPTIATKAKPSASHVHGGDVVTALNDGLEPANSEDHSIPRLTWWDHKGTTEWAAYEFDSPQRISKAEVYWFDDRPRGGGCRVPESWRLLYKDGEAWKPVTGAGEYGTKPNLFNEVTFDAVKTKGLKIEVRLTKGFSGGILEWRLPK